MTFDVCLLTFDIILMLIFHDLFMIELNHNFTDNDSLIEKGIINSTGILELIQFLEENYQIKIEDKVIIPGNLDSFENIERFILRKTKKN